MRKMLISKISLVLMQEKDIKVQLSVTNAAKWVILQNTVIVVDSYLNLLE
jgi:hypothetical protein